MTLEMGKPIGAAGPRPPSARRLAGITWSTASGCWPMSRWTPGAAEFHPLSADRRRCWRSCPGTFRSGRFSGSPRPALMAGNVGLLKHASNVPQCALAIEDVIRRAGFPGGCLPDAADRVATAWPRVLDDPRVKAASLTGSEAAGRAGREPGGQADQEDRARTRRQRPVHRHAQRGPGRAARTAVEARTHQQRAVLHRGQAVHRGPTRSPTSSSSASWQRCRRCGSATRWRSHAGGSAGDARDPGRPGRAGAAVGGAGRERADRREAPATARAITIRRRCWRRPPKDSPAYREELFGPVAVLFRADGVEEAVRLANDTDVRAGASAWTNDEAEQRLFIEELEAGWCS